MKKKLQAMLISIQILFIPLPLTSYSKSMDLLSAWNNCFKLKEQESTKEVADSLCIDLLFENNIKSKREKKVIARLIANSKPMTWKQQGFISLVTINNPSFQTENKLIGTKANESLINLSVIGKQRYLIDGFGFKYNQKIGLLQNVELTLTSIPSLNLNKKKLSSNSFIKEQANRREENISALKLSIAYFFSQIENNPDKYLAFISPKLNFTKEKTLKPLLKNKR